MSTPTSVYRYYDSDGALVYVGITARGIQRQNEHNAHAEWWPFVVRQDVEHYPDRDEAAARERELIQRFRPPFNKQHNEGCEALKSAYLSTHATPAHVPTCDWDEECDMGTECPAFGGDDWCGVIGCTSCHRAWHRYGSGYSDGHDQGEANFTETIAWLCSSEDPAVAEAAYELRARLSRLMNVAYESAVSAWQAQHLQLFITTDAQVQQAARTKRELAESRRLAEERQRNGEMPF